MIDEALVDVAAERGVAEAGWRDEMERSWRGKTGVRWGAKRKLRSFSGTRSAPPRRSPTVAVERGPCSRSELKANQRASEHRRVAPLDQRQGETGPFHVVRASHAWPPLNAGWPRPMGRLSPPLSILSFESVELKGVSKRRGRRRCCRRASSRRPAVVRPLGFALVGLRRQSTRRARGRQRPAWPSPCFDVSAAAPSLGDASRVAIA